MCLTEMLSLSHFPSLHWGQLLLSNNLTPPTPSPPCRDRPRQAGQSESFTNERALTDPPAPGLWACQVQAPAERGPACRNVRDPQGGGLRGGLLSPPWWQRRHEDTDRVCGQCCTSFRTQDGLSPKPPLLVLPCWGPDGLYALYHLVSSPWNLQGLLGQSPRPQAGPQPLPLPGASQPLGHVRVQGPSTRGRRLRLQRALHRGGQFC